jgi:hypothetical protein
MRAAALALLVSLSLWSCAAPSARAEAAMPDLPQLGSPYAPLVRQQYYERLAKSPWRALGWELLAPGGGNQYVGLPVPAAITLGVSLLGAGLWIAGGVSDRSPLLWAGVGTFAAARAYGLVSAPLAAAMLNAAFRGQLGVSGVY